MHWAVWAGMGVLSSGLCLALGCIAAADSIRRRGRRFRPQPADVAIILGAYTHGYRPSPTLRARLRAGLHLYRCGYVERFIVTGGRGEDESVAEASSMKWFLIVNGVSPEAIVEERLSADTWENLRNSRHVMDRLGLKTAIIVTSDYHLPRAFAVARHLGMDVSGFAAWSPRRELRYAVREVFAWVKYWRDGQLSLLRVS
ncbi:YdcF family protein [Alicyclobacillus herbarius]|uniref:YdcF family protein n=1 Tax=Alicyclobacillus herbarius TaxID=122960 RepID=UPI000409717E|nr:YdcF family protein [Alicyclobacillus herbarius]